MHEISPEFIIGAGQQSPYLLAGNGIGFNTGGLYYKRGQKHEALPYFEKVAQLGDSQAPLIVEHIKQELGMAP